MHSRKSYVIFGLFAMLVSSCNDASFGGKSAAPSGKDSSQSTGGHGAKEAGDMDSSEQERVDKSSGSKERSDPDFVFGATTIYRIGDGDANVSACQGFLDTFPTTYESFSFGFEVPQNSTKIRFVFGTICGLDSNENSISFLRDGVSYRPRLVAEPAYPFKIGYQVSGGVFYKLRVLDDANGGVLEIPSAVFDKGSYKLVVRSRSETGSDLDDFAVGNIQVFSDKGVTAGDIRGE